MDRSLTIHSIIDLAVAFAHAQRLVDDIVARAMVAVARRLNLRSRAVTGVPPELLIDIFERLPVHDRIRASHICHFWREKIISTPSVWSSVIDEPRLGPGALPSILHRSGSRGLMLSLVVDSSNWESICSILDSHLSRCVVLEINILTAIGTIAEDRITESLSRAAPRLREFRIWDLCGTLNRRATDDALLFAGGHSPLKVFRARIDSYQLRPCDSLSSVTRLRYASSTGLWSAQETLATFLSLCPALEHLAVVFFAKTYVDPSAEAWSSCVLPASLKSLLVVAEDSAAVLHPISYLNVGDRLPVRLNYLTCPTEAEAIAATDALFRGIAITRLGLYRWSFDTDFNVTIMNGNGYGGDWLRYLANVPRGVLDFKACVLSLTSLSTDEPSFAEGILLHDAPALTYLAIWLLTPAEHRSDSGDCSIWLLPSTPHTVMRCPRLKKLQLAAHPLDSPFSPSSDTYVTPDMIQDFIRHHLYHEGALELLELEGIQVVESRVEEVASLLAIVHDVVHLSPYEGLPDMTGLDEWNFDI